MTDSKLEIKIPEQLIHDTIRSAMLRSLADGGGADVWVEKIVEHAMGEKTNAHSRETIWTVAVNKAIRDEAASAFKEWLQGNRVKFRKVMLRKLKGDGADIMKAIADGVTSDLTSVYASVSVNLSKSDDE